MDPQADEPRPAPRGQAARPGGRGATGRRQPASASPKKPPVAAVKKPASARGSRGPREDSATAAASSTERILRGPTRSVARTATVGRPAAASAAVPVAEVVEVAEVVAVPELVVGEPAPDGPAPVEPPPDGPAPVEPASVEVVPDEVELAAAEVVDAAPVASIDGAVLVVRGLTKRYGATIAVDGIDLEVPAGVFYGFVGPNGAGKTTTLSMLTGLLRPDGGSVLIDGIDVWRDPRTATRSLGVLPDRLRLFDRLTGAEYLQHAGALHGLDRETIVRRAADLVQAFGLESATQRFVSDFSAGMVKKLAIAAAMIHSPRLLVLDEPFESVDPVSAQLVIDVLTTYTQAGATVLLSSHSMDLVERVCDDVAIIADGRLLAAGPMAEVLRGVSLEQRFVDLAGGATAVEGMEWLQSFSD